MNRTTRTEQLWFWSHIAGTIALGTVFTAVPIAYFFDLSGPLRELFVGAAIMFDALVPFVEIGDMVIAVLFLLAAIFWWVMQYHKLKRGPRMPFITDSMAMEFDDWQERD